MSTLPPQEVIDAIETGNSQVTRRVALFESDAVTPWNPDEDAVSRLVDGSVTIDGSKDERRTLEVKLDNTDNALRPDSIQGLWYDKVIQAFRGIKYYQAATTTLVTATNYADNPGAETGGGWLTNNATVYPVTFDTTIKRSGSRSAKGTKIVGGGASSACASMYAIGMQDPTRLACTPGEVLIFSVYMRAGQAGYRGQVGFIFYNSGGTSISSPVGGYFNLPAGSWTRVSCTLAVPAGGVSFYPYGSAWTNDGSNAPDNHFANFDDAMIQHDTSNQGLLPFFNGD